MEMLFHPPRVALSRIAAAILIILVCVAFESGCASSPRKVYDGPELPAPEVVTVRGTSYFAFWSQILLRTVDDKFAVGMVSVLPGAHWYRVEYRRRSKLAMIFFVDHFYTEAVCSFMLEGAPGTAYSLLEIDSVGSVPTEERELYKASMKIEERIANRNPIVRQIPIECVKWGSLSGLAAIGPMQIVDGRFVSQSLVTRMAFAVSPNPISGVDHHYFVSIRNCQF